MSPALRFAARLTLVLAVPLTARHDATAAHSAPMASQNVRTSAARRIVNFASDRADFVNPAKGQVLSLDYDAIHSWDSSDGRSVVLNADATYDPNGAVTPMQSSWVELVPQN